MKVRTTRIKHIQNSTVGIPWIKLSLAIAIGLILIYLFLFAGSHLVENHDFEHQKYAVVLSGQSNECERTDKAIQLLKQRSIDTVLLSSERIFKSHYMDEYLLGQFREENISSEQVMTVRHEANSTLEEAKVFIPILRQKNADTVVLITSNFHTHRAGQIFNHLANGNPVFLPHVAEFYGYQSHNWWSSRLGLKTFVMEWTKTIFTKFELFFTKSI